MPEPLADWILPEIALEILSNMPAPRSPSTGEALWESGIRLHGAQREALLDAIRHKKLDGGIRFGKSYLPALAVFIDSIWRFKFRRVPNDLWGFVGDAYSQTEPEMEHLARFYEEAGLPFKFEQPKGMQWAITFPYSKQRIQTLTSSDITKIAGKPYRGIVMTEANQQVPEVRQQCRLRVAETRGWTMMSGTFENSKGPWYAQLTEEWNKPDAIGKVYICPSWDNPVAFPGGRMDPEIISMENELAPAIFMEKVGGIPQSPSDVVFPEARFSYHVKDRFPALHKSFDPELPVYLAIDPGSTHACAVLAIQIGYTPEFRAEVENAKLATGNVIWVIDSIYRWNRETEQLVQEAASRPWAKNVQEAVMDFAGKQRNANGKPVIEQWAKFWRARMGSPLAIHANPVPLEPAYSIHKRALLNGWPEEHAQLMFNRDGAIRSKVANPAGPQIYYAPQAAAPFFGGQVDDQKWAGEYSLHRNHRNKQGLIDRVDPVPLYDDGIKALQYFLYWYFKVSRQGHRYFGRVSTPWAIQRAG